MEIQEMASRRLAIYGLIYNEPLGIGRNS